MKTKSLITGFLCALCVSVASAQTPVTISTVNIYGPAANATVTFRPVQQVGIDYPNYVLGSSISVTPTNGAVTTNLLEGAYIISFSGQYASQRVYVPGLWITNMGYALPLNLASAAWQFPVGAASIIVTNSGGGSTNGGTPIAAGTAISVVPVNGTYIISVQPQTFDAFGQASNALATATNLAGAAQAAAQAASDPAGSAATAAQQATNTAVAGLHALIIATNAAGTNAAAAYAAAAQAASDPVGAANAATNSLANGISATYQTKAGTFPASQLTGTAAINTSGHANSATNLNGPTVSSASGNGLNIIDADGSAMGITGGGITINYTNNSAVPPFRLNYAGNNTMYAEIFPNGTLWGTALVITNFGSSGSITASNGALTAIGPITGASFTGNGSALTSLNASALSSGTVPTAQLGSGTASSTTFLRGDQTWATPSGGGTSTNFGSTTYWTNPPTISAAGIPELYFGGTNGSKPIIVGIGNWYSSNAIFYVQSVSGPISFDLRPPEGTTNTANLDLCAWFNEFTGQGQYADIAIHPNTGGTESMWVGGIGSGAATPSLVLDPLGGGISFGGNGNLQYAEFPGYQSIPTGGSLAAPANFTLYASYGTQNQIAAGGVDPNAAGWLAWAFQNNTNHDLQLVPQGGYVSLNGYLTATNGVSSLATNATLHVTSTGLTNTLAMHYRIFGFTGTSVTQTNPISHIGFSYGTITTPTPIDLQSGEFVNGSSCAAVGGQAW